MPLRCCCLGAPSFAIEIAGGVRYNDTQGGDSVNQRQLNMIQACQEGIEQARRDLMGPGSERVMRETLEEIGSEEPCSMGLAKAAYIAAMFIAWKDRGSPDIFT